MTQRQEKVLDVAIALLCLALFTLAGALLGAPVHYAAELPVTCAEVRR